MAEENCREAQLGKTLIQFTRGAFDASVYGAVVLAPCPPVPILYFPFPLFDHLLENDALSVELIAGNVAARALNNRTHPHPLFIAVDEPFGRGRARADIHRRAPILTTLLDASLGPT